MPFSASYRCSDCSHVFEKVTKRDPRKGGRLPSCPKCSKGKYSTIKSISKSNTIQTPEEADKNINEICESRRAPATGKSNFTKAMDATSEMVMRDYGMTNLQDNLREGDSMVPKLRPELEQRVDQVFKPQKPVAGAPANTALNKTIMNQINAGKFKGFGGSSDVVARQQNSGIRVPTNIVHEYGGNKPN